MCVTCGCGNPEHPAGTDEPLRLDHHHEPADGVDTVMLEERVLARNDHLAEHVRAWLAVRRITAVNLMSSPGAGKTTLLERTVGAMSPRQDVTVIEGDQETRVDAERIERAGARALQVNTGSGCHLDAGMVRRALDELVPPAGSLLFVENVGNLVCPALFDVGEQAKVVVISVTEGDDKPLKYPHMFSAADVVVVNKTDLLPHVDFDLVALTGRARSLNPRLEVLPLSARTGDGLDAWFAWLDSLTRRHGTGTEPHPEGAAHGTQNGP